MYIYIYHIICVTCLIYKKRRSSLGQTLIKIKHKAHSFLRRTNHMERLGYIVFTFFVNSIKKFFEQTKF